MCCVSTQQPHLSPGLRYIQVVYWLSEVAAVAILSVSCLDHVLDTPFFLLDIGLMPGSKPFATRTLITGFQGVYVRFGDAAHACALTCRH